MLSLKRKRNQSVHRCGISWCRGQDLNSLWLGYGQLCYQLHHHGIGAQDWTRTSDLLIFKQALLPTELPERLVRLRGIEPLLPTWQAGVLPLDYNR